MSDTKTQLYKILMLGDSALLIFQQFLLIITLKRVGKTSLIDQYVNQKFTQQHVATIGANFMAKNTIIDGKKLTLQIWDTAGQERYQSLGGAFYRGADCCALVYDIAKMKSFESLENWLELFILQGNIKDKETFPFIIIGNKQDKIEERQVLADQAQEWCKKKGSNFTFFECSAKESINVESAFQAIAKLAASQEKDDDEMIFPPTVDLQKPTSKSQKQQKKKNCC